MNYAGVKYIHILIGVEFLKIMNDNIFENVMITWKQYFLNIGFIIFIFQDDQCLSVVYGNKKCLDLVLDNETERNRWLAGLKYLQKNSEENELNEEQETYPFQALILN